MVSEACSIYVSFPGSTKKELLSGVLLSPRWWFGLLLLQCLWSTAHKVHLPYHCSNQAGNWDFQAGAWRFTNSVAFLIRDCSVSGGHHPCHTQPPFRLHPLPVTASKQGRNELRWLKEHEPGGPWQVSGVISLPRCSLESEQQVTSISLQLTGHH